MKETKLREKTFRRASGSKEQQPDTRGQAMPRWRVPFCLVLACWVGTAWAQKPAPTAAEAASAPTKVAQVRLSVEVTDKAGHPIPGLQETDFTVLDDRKPAPLRFFYAHESGVADPGAESMILLIDEVNEDLSAVTFERDQIEKFLRSNQGRLPAPLSIVMLSETELTPIAEASADGNLLAEEFLHWEGHARPVPPTADWGAEERWQESQQALDKILRYEARRPGRKLLLWIGPGWSLFTAPDVPIDEGEQKRWMDLIVNASTRLHEAQVTLYSVDPLGVGTGLEDSRWQALLKPVRKPDQAYLGDLALQVLATQSGGQVVDSSNDLASELMQCLNDASAWYTLVIAAQSSEQPNTWHDVQVKVDRPGAVARTIDGYYAHPEP
ncbi:MAG: VWA domain-containing protein [Acidobacteriaceae bacterium]